MKSTKKLNSRKNGYLVETVSSINKKRDKYIGNTIFRRIFNIKTKSKMKTRYYDPYNHFGNNSNSGIDPYGYFE
jgi:hypothetical protein